MDHWTTGPLDRPSKCIGKQKGKGIWHFTLLQPKGSQSTAQSAPIDLNNLSLILPDFHCCTYIWIFGKACTLLCKLNVERIGAHCCTYMYVGYVKTIPIKYESSPCTHAVCHSAAVGLFSPMAAFTVLDFIIIFEIPVSMLPVENGLLMAE